MDIKTVKDIPAGLRSDILEVISNAVPKKQAVPTDKDWDDYYSGQIDMRSDIYWSLKELFEKP